MKTEKFTFPSAYKDQPVSAVVWEPETEPVGVVQICHGMNEHMGRYEAFAGFLTNAGYAVCMHDQLGHGDTARGRFGYFARQGGYKYLVRDTHSLMKLMKARYKGLPYILLGHSMGSFIVRLHCARYASGPDALILSGTGRAQPMMNAGLALARSMTALGRGRQEGRTIHRLSRYMYNKRIQEPRTSVDWLSRDEETTERYLRDPKTRFVFTYSAYADLFTILKKISSDSWPVRIPRELPIYLFSGDADPVGDYGEGVRAVYDSLVTAGCVSVTLKLYPGGRHEMLNELNRREVYADVLDWISKIKS
jgi:alpha-beta hydrolase superfamily lysophospholipase